MHWSVRAGAPRVLSALTLASVVVATPVSGQTGTSAPPSQGPPFIAASAIGQTHVTPDRAMLQVAVESQGESAAAAAAENARKQTRVIEAAKAAGVAPAQIRTSGYNVYPDYAQSGGKAPKLTGYRARNTVQVEVRNIDNVGAVIDAALGAGATNIGSVGLYASSTDTARREALQQAVTKARTEAEAAATAAGGSLGPLLELTIDPYGMPRPLSVQVTSSGGFAGGAPMPTPIEAGEYLVIATVRGRWLFMPGQR